jgi:hypothetical protein
MVDKRKGKLIVTMQIVGCLGEARRGTAWDNNAERERCVVGRYGRVGKWQQEVVGCLPGLQKRLRLACLQRATP